MHILQVLRKPSFLHMGGFGLLGVLHQIQIHVFGGERAAVRGLSTAWAVRKRTVRVASAENLARCGRDIFKSHLPATTPTHSQTTTLHLSAHRNLPCCCRRVSTQTRRGNRLASFFNTLDSCSYPEHLLHFLRLQSFYSTLIQLICRFGSFET